MVCCRTSTPAVSNPLPPLSISFLARASNREVGGLGDIKPSHKATKVREFIQTHQEKLRLGKREQEGKRFLSSFSVMEHGVGWLCFIEFFGAVCVFKSASCYPTGSLDSFNLFRVSCNKPGGLHCLQITFSSAHGYSPSCQKCCHVLSPEP